MSRLKGIGVWLAFLGLAAGCGSGSNSTASAAVAARVNGKDITMADLERKFRVRASGDTPVSEEEAQDLKLQILSEMIADEILLSLAAKQDLSVTDAELEARFIAFRGQYSDEAFKTLLAQQNTTTEEMKSDIRRALILEKLINKEVTSHIKVSDQEVLDFYNRYKSRFDLPEGFHIAHILVTNFPDSEVRNAKGDDARTPDEARDKAVRLLKQVQGSADFAAVARDYSEDPTSATQGGDLGFQSLDSLNNIDPRLGQIAQKMKPGEIWPKAVETRFGFHIIKLLERDPGGQKELSDPRVQARIHQELFNGKDRALKAALADAARNKAQVTNYLAERILSTAGVELPN
ncbi:MAG TPA: peptidylprolyl isomerase [Terriglobia bacterium]|nr:peptidylprolyl isomerase [Terriglobia bacterium]